MNAESVEILIEILKTKYGRSDDDIKNLLLSTDPDFVLLLRELLAAMGESTNEDEKSMVVYNMPITSGFVV